MGWRCNTHGDGPYVGDSSPYLCRVGRARILTDLIADLIAELREQRDIWLEPGMDSADDATFQVVASQVTALTDRAEARLNEARHADGQP